MQSEPGMERNAVKVYILLATMLACSGLAWAQGPGLLPLTRQEVFSAVAAYLRAHRLSEEQLPQAGELELPGTIPARSERTLRVTAVCWDEPMDRAAFRLECDEAGACLPFLVYGGIGQPIFDLLRSSQVTEISSTCSVQTGTRTRKVSRPEIVVRPGDRATVVFRGTQVRLSQQVTCVERGAAGDIIRVRNSEGTLFRARVVTGGRLEALSQ